jgi:hypothetical protein
MGRREGRRGVVQRRLLLMLLLLLLRRRRRLRFIHLAAGHAPNNLWSRTHKTRHQP